MIQIGKWSIGSYLQANLLGNIAFQTWPNVLNFLLLGSKEVIQSSFSMSANIHVLAPLNRKYESMIYQAS